MKFFDAFGGIGGFRLGMERAGHQCVGYCEIDPAAVGIYNLRFEEQHDPNDIRNLHDLPDFGRKTQQSRSVVRTQVRSFYEFLDRPRMASGGEGG